MSMHVNLVALCVAALAHQAPASQEVIDRPSGMAFLEGGSRVIRTCDVWYEVRRTRNFVAVSFDAEKQRATFRHATEEERRIPTVSLHRLVAADEKYRFEEYDAVTRKPRTICVIHKGDWRCKDFTAQTGPTFSVRQSSIPPGGAYVDYREFLTTHCAGSRMSDLVSQRQSLRFSRERNGDVVLHVEPEPDRPVSARFFGYRLILDPARSLMAKEMAKIFKGQSVFRSETLEWLPLEKGVHAPIRARITTHFEPEMQFAGALYSEYEFLVNVVRSTWNRPIDPGVFELTADAGMPIYDTVKGVMTLGGKSDPGQNIDELAKHAMKYTKTAPVGQVERSGGNRWAVVGCVATGLAVVGWGAWRFVRRGA